MTTRQSLSLISAVGGLLLAKQERSRTDVWCPFLYAFQQTGYIFRMVEFRRQCNDVTAFTKSEIVPFIEFGVYFYCIMDKPMNRIKEELEEKGIKQNWLAEKFGKVSVLSILTSVIVGSQV